MNVTFLALQIITVGCCLCFSTQIKCANNNGVKKGVQGLRPSMAKRKFFLAKNRYSGLRKIFEERKRRKSRKRGKKREEKKHKKEARQGRKKRER